MVGVTFADRLPRTDYGYYRVALDGSASVAAASGTAGASEAQRPLPSTRIAFVDPSYPDVLEAPILAGRGFQAADLAPGASVAIVDQGFVDASKSTSPARSGSTSEGTSPSR